MTDGYLLAKKALEVQRYPTIKGVNCRTLPYSFKYLKVHSKDPSVNPEEKLSYVFVKGFLNEKWTHEDLHKAFEKWGIIVSAKVSIDKDHQCKGYGYIQYQKSEQAAKAIQEVRKVYGTMLIDEWVQVEEW